MAVDDDAGHLLTRALPHQPGLVVVHRKTFFQGDRRHLDGQPFGRARKLAAAREHQVVRVAAVGGTARLRQRLQAHVEAPGAQVSQRR